MQNGEDVEVFWTDHDDLDIEYFKVHYDIDGEEPYDGTGLTEGDSPIQTGNVLSFNLSGADSAFSYTIAVTAVDSAGSESEFSSPYTVFALEDPEPVDDLTIRIEGADFVLEWSAVAGGAQYLVEQADNPDGPWAGIAQTFNTTLTRNIEPIEPAIFFRVTAQR